MVPLVDFVLSFQIGLHVEEFLLRRLGIKFNVGGEDGFVARVIPLVEQEATSVCGHFWRMHPLSQRLF